MKHLFTLLCLTVLLTVGKTQPGTLDKSYGNEGAYISGILKYNILSSAIQQDNKVIIGGVDWTQPQSTYILIRHNTDGSVDSSFGDDGKVTTLFTDYVLGDGWQSLQVQPDGKILATGFEYIPDDNNYPPYDADIVMARFNADGTSDPSFGNNGIVITDLGRYEAAYATALQPDGKIVVTGISSAGGVGNSTNMLTLRYNTDGTLDKTFGGMGYTIYDDEGLAADWAYAVAIQQDGKIVIGGSYSVHESYMVVRYLPDGNVDSSFGMDGRVTTRFSDNGGNDLDIKSIVIDKNQNIVAGGLADRDNMVVARYKPDGSLDNSFNIDGTKTLHFRSQESDLTTVLLQNDGKLLLTGGVGPNGPYTTDVALVRLLPDGSYDSSFGTNGQVISDFGGNERVNHAVLQKDGKIVIAGADNSGAYFLARYNVGTDKQPLAIRIKRWMQHHGISWNGAQSNNIRYYTVQRSSDGITYKDIAKVSNKANTYEDNPTLATDSYYRIAAVSWDGSRTYSNTVLIGDMQQALIYPNPVRSNLQLQGLPASGKTNLSIVDLYGNVRSTATATGANYSVNTANLNSGNYLLKIQHGNMVTTQPFVKE